MKLLDDKGRLFGRINIIDFLMLLVLILVVAALAWFFVGSYISDLNSASGEVTITCRVRGAQPYAVNEIMSLNLGDTPETRQQLVSGNNYVDDAWLVGVRAEDYRVQVPTDDGRIIDALDPVRKDLLFTIKAKSPLDKPITKIGSQEIRVGRDHTIKTRQIEYISIIERVDYPDDGKK